MWRHFHFLVDDTGPFYGAMSGWVPDLTMLGVIAAWYHKHNCHQPGCWRISRHTVLEPDGSHTTRCRKHHNERNGT